MDGQVAGVCCPLQGHCVAGNPQQYGIVFQPGRDILATVPCGTLGIRIVGRGAVRLFRNDVPKPADWDEQWGDRVNKLVFIGVQMDREEIIRTLDETLLTDTEMVAGNWRELADPLPKF